MFAAFFLFSYINCLNFSKNFFRRELLAYLKGEREQPPQNVDVLAPIPAPIPLSRLIDQGEPDAKKARYDGEENRYTYLRFLNIFLLYRCG